MHSTAPWTEAQAERRLAGLRILSRIIARRYIQDPERNADWADAAGVSASREDGREDAGPSGRESEREEAR